MLRRITAARDLADQVHRRWLEENPFAATMYGITGYDDRVPDESEAGQQAWQAELEQYLADADAIEAATRSPIDATKLGADADRRACCRLRGWVRERSLTSDV